MGNIGGGRVIKVCDICGGVDDHPRHVIAGTVTDVMPQPEPSVIARVVELAPPDERDRLIRDLLDTSSQERHLDCCAEVGCPTGMCPEVIHAAGSKRGAALLKHITNAKG